LYKFSYSTCNSESGLAYTFAGGTDTVTPSVTTSYSATGTDANGCVSSIPGITTITVINTVTLSVGGTSAVCIGETATLSVNGAGSYSWSTGEFTGTIIPTPTVSSTYTVIGSTGTCADTAFISVQVNSLPSVQISSSSSVMCVGENVTLSSLGADTYLWNGGETTAIVVINPTITTNYTVTGVDAKGCTNKATFTQSVTECLGIRTADVDPGSFIKLYPNPNTGEFIVETGQHLNMVVLNALGQVVLEKELTEGKNRIVLEEQAKGIYFIEFKNKSHSKTIKVIKQ